MNYGELADNYRLSFPEARFGSYEYLGGNILKLTEFKTKKDDKGCTPVKEAIVIFNQNGKTIIIDNETNQSIEVTPLTEKEYNLFKQSQHIA